MAAVASGLQVGVPAFQCLAPFQLADAIAQQPLLEVFSIHDGKCFEFSLCGHGRSTEPGKTESSLNALPGALRHSERLVTDDELFLGRTTKALESCSTTTRMVDGEEPIPEIIGESA